MKPKILSVVGTNASGKSDLAVKLALHFNGEVISADSRQLYRGLDWVLESLQLMKCRAFLII